MAAGGPPGRQGRFLTDDADLRQLMAAAHRIAVVGVSPRPERPSNMVARYLAQQGYEVIPVNPGLESWEGLACYPAVEAAPGPVDVVDVFRAPEAVPGHVEDAIRAGARAVWLQPGARNDLAAARAREAGLDVVVDRCLMQEHRRLLAGR